MKKELFTLSMIIISGLGFAQVGINNTDPKVTLEVTAKATDATTAEGFIAPLLSGDQIQGKDAKYAAEQIGALLYATSAVSVPGGTKTNNITKAGYYYFNGTEWISATSTLGDLRLVGTGNHISQDAGVGSNGTSAGTGYSNIIVGNGNANYPAAGNSMTTGYRNIFLGETAGNANTTGFRNTIVGAPSFTANTTGNENTAFGNSTLRFSTGNRNTVLGAFSMNQNTTGSSNTALGHNALYENQAGNFNIAIGSWAGYSVQGNKNIAIGYNAAVAKNTINPNTTLADISNQMSIGNLIYANGVDGTAGTVSNGNVGIAVKDPKKRLHIANPGGAVGTTSVRLNDIPTYANEAAAATGGLAAGDVYKTVDAVNGGFFLKIKG